METGELRMQFHVLLNPEQDGWIVAECPAFPGCVSQGRTEQEALANIREAITLWLWTEDRKALQTLPSHREPRVVSV